MKNIFTLFFLMVTFSLFSQPSNQVPIPTTYSRLISSPSFYNNKRIIIDGFLHVKFEDYALYASKEVANYLIQECIVVTFDTSSVKYKLASSFDRKYVRIEGVFSYDEKLSPLYRESVRNAIVIKEIRKAYK